MSNPILKRGFSNFLEDLNTHETKGKYYFSSNKRHVKDLTFN